MDICRYYLLSILCIETSRVLPTNIEEYVPDMTPTARARAKYLIDSPPNIYMARSTNITVRDVFKDLTKV
jgi:hypothetical protein